MQKQIGSESQVTFVGLPAINRADFKMIHQSIFTGSDHRSAKKT